MVREDSSNRSARYEDGMRIRREVLGDEYVDDSIASATELTRPLQEMVAEYCWGYVWARPQLDRRSRSLINLGMLTALGKPRELESHVRGAIRNGCSVDEIREAVLQAAVYCGIPAGLEAMKVVQEVLEPSLVETDGD